MILCIIPGLNYEVVWVRLLVKIFWKNKIPHVYISRNKQDRKSCQISYGWKVGISEGLVSAWSVLIVFQKWVWSRIWIFVGLFLIFRRIFILFFLNFLIFSALLISTVMYSMNYWYAICEERLFVAIESTSRRVGFVIVSQVMWRWLVQSDIPE